MAIDGSRGVLKSKSARRMIHFIKKRIATFLLAAIFLVIVKGPLGGLVAAQVIGVNGAGSESFQRLPALADRMSVCVEYAMNSRRKTSGVGEIYCVGSTTSHVNANGSVTTTDGPRVVIYSHPLNRRVTDITSSVNSGAR
jgi:hypothetical protein